MQDGDRYSALLEPMPDGIQCPVIVPFPHQWVSQPQTRTLFNGQRAGKAGNRRIAEPSKHGHCPKISLYSLNIRPGISTHQSGLEWLQASQHRPGKQTRQPLSRQGLKNRLNEYQAPEQLGVIDGSH